MRYPLKDIMTDLNSGRAGRPVQPPKRRSLSLARFCIPALCFLLSFALSGCKTACVETSFARPFDTARVAELSHDSAKLAWNARFSASTDLRVTAVHPTGLDWEVVRRLQWIYDKVPWM